MNVPNDFGPEQVREALQRFIAARPDLNVGNWTKSAGLAYNTLKKILIGKTRDVEWGTLQRLAAAAGVTIGELLGLPDGPTLMHRQAEVVYVPLWGAVGPGVPEERFRRPESEWGSLPIINPGDAEDLAAVTVEGADMAREFPPGTVLFFRPVADDRPARPGDYVIVAHDTGQGGEHLCRRLAQVDGEWWLNAETDDPRLAAPIPLASRPGALPLGGRVRVLGVVVTALKAYR
jgi:DNA-binding Xre family transcriptional regulator